MIYLLRIWTSVLGSAGWPTMAWSSGETPQTLFRPPGPPLLLVPARALQKKIMNMETLGQASECNRHIITHKKGCDRYTLCIMTNNSMENLFQDCQGLGGKKIRNRSMTKGKRTPSTQASWIRLHIWEVLSIPRPREAKIQRCEGIYSALKRFLD